MHVAEAYQVLSSVDQTAEATAVMPPERWAEVEARLVLSRKLLGGLVRRTSVQQMSSREKDSLALNRGLNWELLRQRAESQGLYFEPVAFGEPTPSYALLWISRTDLNGNTAHGFDGSLLKIANPWSNERLIHWKGYQQTWRFDSAGTRVDDPEVPGLVSESMIPLALYSLDYPPAPMILIDFRDEWKPKRREVIFRLADYTATGVLGLTGFGNWSYLAARTSWNFLRHRYGENVDRTLRVSAYAQFRHPLFFDGTLDPELRDLLEKRLEHLSLNPFEHGLQDYAAIPRRQYAALLDYANDPRGLPARLARDRGREMEAMVHGPAARLFLDAGTVFSLGIYKHREPSTPPMLAQLERRRRLQADLDYLLQAVTSSPRIEVVWDQREIEQRLNEIEAFRPQGRELDSGMAELIARVFAQTRDDTTRRLCLESLASLNSSGSRRQLQRIAADRAVSQELRTLSSAYLESPDPELPATPAFVPAGTSSITGGGGHTQ